jgi:hypothetical protein
VVYTPVPEVGNKYTAKRKSFGHTPYIFTEINATGCHPPKVPKGIE